MTNEEIAKRIAERLIRPGNYSVDLCLPIIGMRADQLFCLVTLERAEMIDILAEDLRQRMAQAVLKILEEN